VLSPPPFHPILPAIDFLTGGEMSFPSYIPVSDALPNPQHGQDWPKDLSQYGRQYLLRHSARCRQRTSLPPSFEQSPPPWPTIPLTHGLLYSIRITSPVVNVGSYPGAPILGSPSSSGSQGIDLVCHVCVSLPSSFIDRVPQHIPTINNTLPG